MATVNQWEIKMPKKGFVGSADMAALLNQSPYQTRYMLWAQHKHGIVGDDISSDDRVDWGARLERPILEAVAEERGWEIEPNNKFMENKDPKLRSGSTVDSFVLKHERGMGIVEVKNVDWMIHKDQWTDTMAPPHIEIQLQKQLFDTGAVWGAIGVLIGGNDLRILDREPMPEVFEMMRSEIVAFWKLVDGDEEPDVLGTAKEIPTLNALYPEVEETKVEERFDDAELSEAIRMAVWSAGQESFAKKLKAAERAKILAASKDAGILRANGWKVRISKSETAESVVTLPQELRVSLTGALFDKNPQSRNISIQSVLNWPGQVTRKAGVRTNFNIKEVQGDPKLPDPLDFKDEADETPDPDSPDWPENTDALSLNRGTPR